MPYFKRFFQTAFIAAAAFILFAGQAFALSCGAGTVTGDALRLREHPGTDADVLTTMASGTSVVVLEDAAGGWYKISWQGKTGYVSSDYLEVSTDANADLGSGKVATEGSSLNVRAGAGSEYDRVASLANGSVVKITGIKDGWFKIEWGGGTGYVSSDYITPCEASARSASSGYAPTPDTTGLIGNGNATDAGLEIVAYAEGFLGTPYVYGGNGPNSFDCSGFVKYVFSQMGYSINRTASTQLQNGTAVEKSELQPGDIVFFKNKGDSHAASHVGIYVGGETFIHASSDTREVEYSSLTTSNNAKKYIAARRIVAD